MTGQILSWPPNVLEAIKSGPIPVRRGWRNLPVAELTRGEKVCRFIETFLVVPEGDLVGQPIRLLAFQECFILAVYDNPHGTGRAYLSIARKNSKTATIACLLLAHIVGPEAFPNSRMMSGARSRKQAAEVYNYASKMLLLSQQLNKKYRLVPSSKTIVGLSKAVEYQASSAEAKSAHGGSPLVAILDEVGQIKGPHDDFVEAIVTSQGAYGDKAMIFAISTQAATDGDLFSRWLDDAEASKAPRTVSHLYTADADCDVMDEEAWKAANPALGYFKSVSSVRDDAERASRMPTEEASFRWLHLNQRIDANAPFVSPAIWRACNAGVVDFDGLPVFGGLDLSEVSDLTALVLMAPKEQEGKTVWHVKPTFWLPGDNIRAKAKADRVPYDIWHKDGHLEAAPGKTVDYEFVAHYLRDQFEEMDIRKIAFDRWNFRHLKPWLQKAGFTDDQLEGDDAVFQPFGQGFQSMSPALRELESIILNGNLAHGDHPVLTMCMMNATVKPDPAGNRKLVKHNRERRIDGAVALAMATAMAGTYEVGDSGDLDDFVNNIISVTW
ncbi:terminase large subunit [Agrobacterium tumefaciens]|uniref:terminase large subunit n=1 Tax=Agrobacterium tumefaciens TaxID=358 RepID=UPI002AFEE018|nr:terminase TerL endonuclease subunit [Agrobacterium tumefaciens]MEA1840714.1 terminase TerL endonuclease subunit [Agrobacterium tumefaciens]